MPTKLGTRFWGFISSLLAASELGSEEGVCSSLLLTMPHRVSKIRTESRIRMPASNPFKLSMCSLPCPLCSVRAGCIGVSGFMVRVSSAVYSLEESA